jgi:hypothetical protein
MAHKRTQIFSAMLFCLTAFISACTTDKDIKADIEQKAKNDINFAGVSYTVENKMVTLSGSCPTEKARIKVQQAVKDINVIKGIIDRVQISPIILNDDFSLQQATDSVLAIYPQVYAEVKNHSITLFGKATKKNMDSLIAGVKRLSAAQVSTKLTQIPEAK